MAKPVLRQYLMSSVIVVRVILNNDQMMKGKVVPMKTWLLISVIVASYHASVFCPETEKCEEGFNMRLECNITGNDKFEIYWYRGNIPASEPILDLKNGKFGGKEHQKGVYDLTNTGALTINNVKKEHAGFYNILVYYEGNSYEGRIIEVKVLEAPIVCPDIVRFEEGNDVSIRCNINGSDKFDLLWYVGERPSTEPIFELKNWRSGGEEHTKGGYRISSTGALTISNAKKQHAGFYFIFVDYENKPNVGRRVQVEVTVLPSPPYPHIDSCSTFDDCRIKVRNNTNLTCKLNRIRRMIPIKWIIEDAQNANITTRPQIAEHDKDTDTWNVSVTLSYTALSCNSTLALKCKAEDDWKLLNHSVASASLCMKKEGHCNARIHERLQEELTYPLLLIAIAIIVLICTCYPWYFFLKKMEDWKRSQERKTSFRIHDEIPSSSSNEITYKFVPTKQSHLKVETRNPVSACKEEETCCASKNQQTTIAQFPKKNGPKASNKCNSSNQQSMKQQRKKGER